MQEGNKKGRKPKEKNYNTPFAKRLRQLLDDCKTNSDTSLDDIASKIEITRQSLGQYKDGNNVPDIITFQKLAKYFKVSYDYLLGETEVKSVDSNIKVACEVTGLSEKAIDNIKNGSSLLSEEAYTGEFKFLMLNSLLSSTEILDIIAAMCDISSIEINNYNGFDIWNDSLNVAFKKLGSNSNSFAQNNALYDDIKAKKDEVTVRKYQIEDNFKKLYLSAIEEFKKQCKA